MTVPTTFLRAFLLGVATGGRSSAGPAALVWSASPAVAARDPLWLSSRPAHIATAVMAAGEAVADKLPATPSRLQPPALAARVAFGAVVGALLGRRYGASSVVTGVVGGLGAAAGSYAGARWRGAASARFGPDLPGALIEDAVTAGLAFAAVR